MALCCPGWIGTIQPGKHSFLQHVIAESLYYPTNAHNVKNVELSKHIKIMETAPTCFGLQRKHHQGATASG